MSAPTEVELVWIKGKIERWIRFGQPIGTRILDRRRRVLVFAPGSIFAFVRWAANDFGTLVSRLDILRACCDGEPRSTIPGVKPGAEILLRLSGWAKVERGLKAIDDVKTLGVAPENVCPDHCRHVHNRFAAGQPARPYTLERHRAWLLRQKVLPPC